MLLVDELAKMVQQPLLFTASETIFRTCTKGLESQCSIHIRLYPPLWAILIVRLLYVIYETVRRISSTDT
jgi:hypothetical protein